jgi:flagellar basal-body rod modification protein FlgD
VRVRVFDGTGRLVRDLSPGAMSAGTRGLRWDGRDQAGRLAPAGLYWIEARAGEWRARTRVTLAR